jgi:Holliday junction resolvase
MAATPEKKVKEQVKRILDKYEFWFFSPPGMGLGRAGIPDIIGCKGGRFIAVECKAGKGKPTLLQERELQNIGLAGGYAIVVNELNLHELEKEVMKW